MVNVSATILGVTLPTLGIMLLVASIFILVFDKQFGWLRTSDLIVKPFQLEKEDDCIQA